MPAIFGEEWAIDLYNRVDPKHKHRILPAVSECLFEFASPPKCGCIWSMVAFENAGIKRERHGSTKIHFPDFTGDLPSLTVRRKPEDWIRSYYDNMWRKRTEVPLIDSLCDLMSDSNSKKVSFPKFIESYLRGSKGAIKYIFDLYKADHVIVMGDKPLWEQAAEILTSLGLDFKKGALLDTEKQNVTEEKSQWPEDLLKEFRKSECST
jgi:hypothetical protein